MREVFKLMAIKIGYHFDSVLSKCLKLILSARRCEVRSNLGTLQLFNCLNHDL